MKKILLLSLVLLSPQVLADFVELECKYLSDSKNFFRIEKDRGGYDFKPSVMRYSVLFLENGKAWSVSERALRAIWEDANIHITGGLIYESASIDRETLRYSEGRGRYPHSSKFEFDCEITNNVEGKVRQWKRQAEQYEKAKKAAKKAKNVI